MLKCVRNTISKFRLQRNLKKKHKNHPLQQFGCYLFYFFNYILIIIHIGFNLSNYHKRTFSLEEYVYYIHTLPKMIIIIKKE